MVAPALQAAGVLQTVPATRWRNWSGGGGRRVCGPRAADTRRRGGEPSDSWRRSSKQARRHRVAFLSVCKKLGIHSFIVAVKMPEGSYWWDLSHDYEDWYTAVFGREYHTIEGGIPRRTGTRRQPSSAACNRASDPRPIGATGAATEADALASQGRRAQDASAAIQVTRGTDAVSGRGASKLISCNI